MDIKDVGDQNLKAKGRFDDGKLNEVVLED